jgi:hypothetical protein
MSISTNYQETELEAITEHYFFNSIRQLKGLRALSFLPVCGIPLNHESNIFFLVCEATVATPGLLCQPRVIVKMIVEKQMECRLAGETEVL